MSKFLIEKVSCFEGSLSQFRYKLRHAWLDYCVTLHISQPFFSDFAFFAKHIKKKIFVEEVEHFPKHYE